ncbi:sialidase family protein [Streptomyces araujoniae]|uniref:sialidase family protein n=1 Tax=Streptomyces sp. ZEA17I TaxID=2202516 RepID=UPI0015E8484D|nr:sialidase family protein [Streptomyces sp. ZEA17I]
MTTCSDIGHNDIVMRKSTDGGRSRGPLKVVVGGADEDSHGNPAPVVDAAAGRVSLLYAAGPRSGKPGEPVRGHRSLRVVHSVDDGTGTRRSGCGWGSPVSGSGNRSTTPPPAREQT